ncbi:MAG: hypothetical protein KAH25_04845 [Bacteroidales bacterium]|nr:hypothetical protein [Bacteroidales bacterium]
MTSRKEQNQDEIIGIIEQWHNSGKNKAEFCKEKNIGRSTFYHWLKIYDNNPIKKVITAEGFTKISAPKKQTSVELRYPNGVIIKINSSDNEILETLI